MVDVLLILERVSLGQHAAATVAEQIDLAQVECDADGLNVLDIALDGVLVHVLQALGLAGAALVNENEAMGARQREQPGKEVGMVGTGTAVEDHKWRAFAELDVVDEYAVGVDEALLHRVDGGGGLGGGLGGEGRCGTQDGEA